MNRFSKESLLYRRMIGLVSWLRRHPLAVKVFGLALMVVGFFISNAKQFPLIERVIVPRYAKTRRAFDYLFQFTVPVHYHHPEDSYFSELVKFAKAELKPQESELAAAFKREPVTRIEFIPTYSQGIDSEGNSLIDWLRFQPTGVRWNKASVYVALNRVRDRASLGWATALFVCGFAINVWGILEKHGPQSPLPEPRIHPDPPISSNLARISHEIARR